MSAIPVLRSVPALREHLAGLRAGGARIGLVPTMGALHPGHLALVNAARASGERPVLTIFVNPKQFGPNEDFATYPRSEAADLGKAAEAGAAAVFAPPVEAIYPPGFATSIRVGGLADDLCGPFRPGHFEGMATVVTKLLLMARPDAAYFGEKDYQQLLIVRRLARDLDIASRIEGVPTVREADGLAMSSRNVRLTPAQRRLAPMLHATIAGLADELSRSGDAAEPRIGAAIATLRAAGFDGVDYLALREAGTLAPLERLDRPARVLVAARLGATRLIDNVPALPPA